MSVIGKQNNTVKFSAVNRGFSAVPECSGAPGFSTCLTQQDGWETRDDRLTKKSRETVHSRSCATVFRHSAVLSLPAVLLRKVCIIYF